ncbi:glycosyltransferase family 4 protein [Streptomyces durbertensis]|uniref:D-inositol 3-phosphate glycosyltransferase n=1 Tax=Streptomyces durbertensis TaxID=2448886 RepID=A0ABR6EMA7_9ACTN|nr:glycosyltransferase [Streptomyces durbertensis]MBB1246461.1 glycosyltransferase family 4 protein [Streptomyces durbertensis]
MKIAFLVYNMYGIGGTVRAVANLASALSEHHEVEVVSVFRRADSPRFPLDPRVRLTPLIDARHRVWRYAHPNGRRPSTMFHDPGPAGSAVPPSRLADHRVAAHLRRCRADVVIATRPLLVGYLAEYGRPDQLRVGWEHRTLDSHNPDLRAEMLAAVARLDAYVTVSDADARQWRAALPPDGGAEVVGLPNAVPAPLVDPLQPPHPQVRADSRTVVAVGRLIPIKRYDRLIEAFAKVAAVRPEWDLRIYGSGRTEGRLRRRIDALGLGDRVRLMGAHAPIETEWAKAAIAAVSSDGESFGMTLVEAMRCGVPVVSTDCPFGPAEIVTPGVDGLLVPLEGGSDAYADALLRLVDDPEERRRLGEAALATGRRYDPADLADRWTRFLTDLTGKRARPAPSSRRKQPGAARDVLSGAAFALGETTGRGVAAVAELVAVRRRNAARRTDPQAPPLPARCAVTEDGSLRVLLDPSAVSATELRDSELVFRRRGAGDHAVRLPIADHGADGVLLSRADHALAEGRWDCRLEPRTQPNPARADFARPVAVTLLDSAALVTLPLATDGGRVAHWVPYATADGHLGLRTWLRPAHAEVEQVLAGEHAVTVVARLLAGADQGPDARVVACGPGPEWEIPVRAADDPSRIEFSLGYATALEHRTAARDAVWDLRYRPGPGRDTVPLGRLAGDIPDRRRTDRYPAVTLDHPTHGATRLRPVFTSRNNLALAMTAAPTA